MRDRNLRTESPLICFNVNLQLDLSVHFLFKLLLSLLETHMEFAVITMSVAVVSWLQMRQAYELANKEATFILLNRLNLTFLSNLDTQSFQCRQ
jgi:hypothetical protein